MLHLIRSLPVTLSTAAVGGALFLAACGGPAGPSTLPAPADDGSVTPGADGPAAGGTDGGTQGIAEGEPNPGTPATTCSASQVTAEEAPPEGLTEVAAAKREAIIAAARSCDFDRLASEAGDEFTFTYGGSEDPASYWRELEANGTPISAIVVHLMQMDHAIEAETEFTVWPAAMVLQGSATDAQWDQLRAIHTDDEIAQYREGPDGYLGWRAGITEDGEWQYLVAGD